MGVVKEVTELVQNTIVPDLKAIRVGLEGLEKDVDRLAEENKTQAGEIKDLNQRLSYLEGALKGLEPALRTYAENLVLRGAISSKPQGGE